MKNNVIKENKSLKDISIKKQREKADTSNCNEPTSYEELKSLISSFADKGKLDTLRFDDCYTSFMKNEWLLDKPINHYGQVSLDYPANSLPAYKEAVKGGFPILISVQMLDDGTCVCFKDKTLGKLTKEDGYIANCTLENIKKLKLEKTDLSIPTLGEALDVIQGKTPIILEIFNESAVGKMEESILKIINQYISKYNAWDSIAILSINPYTLEWFYENAPHFTRIIKSCLFTSLSKYADIKTKILKKLKLTNKIAHADFIAYNAQDLPCKYIEKYKPYGVLAYNVTSQELYEKVLPHIDNVIFSGFVPKI